MTRRRLEDVVARGQPEKVDLIAVTGDFASVINDAIASELVDVLRTLRARDRVVGVLGNHDYWSNAGMVGEAMRQSGIINVSNTVYTLERDPGVLHVAGVDDVWERHNDLDLVMASSRRKVRRCYWRTSLILPTRAQLPTGLTCRYRGTRTAGR